MLEHNFIAPSINIETLDPAFDGLPIVTGQNSTEIDTILSNSFGFGGTNACLLLKGNYKVVRSPRVFSDCACLDVRFEQGVLLRRVFRRRFPIM